MMITFPMALTLLFIGLKLTGYIDWSWWGICLPILIAWIFQYITVIVHEWRNPK